MAQFPFTSQLHDRSYYGPALPNRPPDPEIWSGGQQQLVDPYDQQAWQAAKFGVGVAGLMAAGFVRYRGGNVMNQVYIPFIRGVEEYSPFRMLRTFRVSQYATKFDRAMRGGHKMRDLWKMSGEYSTYLLSRFNKLSHDIPFGVPGFKGAGEAMQAWLIRRGVPEWATHMGVKQGKRALPFFGRIIGKYGIVTAGLYFGYGTMDHYLDQWLGKGPTEFAADMYTGTRKGLASISEMTGAREYALRQEEVAPGSTNLLKLAAFPIMGTLGAGLIQYPYRLGLQAYVQAKKGKTARDAAKVLLGYSVEETRHIKGMLGRFGAAWPKWFNNIGRWVKANRFLGKYINTPQSLLAAAGGLAGAALVAPFVPGALIPTTTSEELEAMYSGEELVPIRKGRWWEMGRTPWEGQRIQYYRPHAIALLKTRAREQGIYGDEQMSPIEKFIKANFTYEFERKNYESRPYPITGAAFEDVPFIGPLLASTLGRFIKPPQLMHTEEWLRASGGSGAKGSQEILAAFNEAATMEGVEGMEGATYRHLPLGFGGHRALELGEIPPGAPITPYGFKGFFSEQWYRMTEMLGLPGFMTEVMKERLTNEGQWFTQEQRLESARRAYGAERQYWDLELGGGFHVGEVLRRLFPHRQRAVPLYNPIRNLMPEWLPGPGERAPDFWHGDPYTKVPMGEVRLPGQGYAALHPELKDVKPDDYPLVHRYRILADIAPYSDQFKYYQQLMQQRKRENRLTDEELKIYNDVRAQMRSRRARKEFDEYRYESADTLAEYNKELAKKGKEPVGTFGQFIGRYWEMLAHKAHTPLEYLTPISPASKLIHMSTAIEDYERTQLYGTQNAFWQHPIRHFLTPFTRATARMLGYSGIPEDIQEVRDIESYFDMLKWIKFKRLKRMAAAEGDWEAAKEFEGKTRETLFGINPYTFNFTHLYRSLPSRERDYFQSFADTRDPETRQKILDMVPEGAQALYQARWRRAREEEIRDQLKADNLEGDQRAQLESELRKIQSDVRNEGIPRTQKLWKEYLRTKMKGESYPDWYRRTKLLEERFEGMPLPGPDWVGWHPGVDLNDIKLKLVQNMGRDMHDFNLWPSDAQRLAHKPFINQGTVDAITTENILDYSELRGRITELLDSEGMEDVQISVAMYPSNSPEYNIDMDIREDRLGDIKKAFFRGV